MSVQNYKNHTRFYVPHHFVFYPIALTLIVLGFRMGSQNPDQKYIWWFLSALTILITWLSFMTRQHYALTLQNRLIRLEVAHRYFVLTGKNFASIDEQLSDGQLFAVRFASDIEFAQLIEKALEKKSSASEIKKEIKDWKADNYRV